MLYFHPVIVVMRVITLAFGVSSLKDPPLNVKEHTAPVLPLLFFLLASNVEASYQRKGIPQMGLGGKQVSGELQGARKLVCWQT